jgi:hypothetical protein
MAISPTLPDGRSWVPRFTGARLSSRRGSGRWVPTKDQQRAGAARSPSGERHAADHTARHTGAVGGPGEARELQRRHRDTGAAVPEGSQRATHRQTDRIPRAGATSPTTPEPRRAATQLGAGSPVWRFSTTLDGRQARAPTTGSNQRRGPWAPVRARLPRRRLICCDAVPWRATGRPAPGRWCPTGRSRGGRRSGGGRTGRRRR